MWFMGTAGGAGAGLQTLDSKVINLLRNPALDKVYWDAREAVDPLNRTADKIYWDPREAGSFLNEPMNKGYQDARETGGLPSKNGPSPFRWNAFGNLEQKKEIQIFTSPMENMIELLGIPLIGGADLPACSNLNWQIQATGDFNGDGKIDILLRCYGPGGYNCVWFMNGTTLTGGANLPACSDLNWRIVNH